MVFEEYFRELQKIREIKEISLFINDICNLKCPYCYAQNLLQGDLVSNDKWMRFLIEAIRDTARIVSIVGKEPFMTPDKTINLLERLNQKFPQTKKGIVTNATLITPIIANNLAKISNLYIDISLDGIPDIHNISRGAETMAKSIQGLFYLREAGIKDIFVSHMLSSANMATFAEFVDFCVANGLKKIVIFPSITSIEDVSVDEYCQFVKQILRDNYLKSHEAKIAIKTDYLSPEINAAVIDQFIDIDKLSEDANGVLYREISVNGNTFYINFLPFPMEFITALRINYDGNVVFCRDMMDFDIDKKAIGNIKEGYSVIKDKILTSKKIKEFYLEHFEYIKKLL